MDEEISGINVTPLVDITLVLLIVFMVTARIIDRESIAVDLPKASTGAVEARVFAVGVDASGGASVEGKAVDDGELGRAADRALARDNGVRVVIEAARSSPHGAVIHVVDVLRTRGMTRIAFAVERADP
jgi:biopolymer transport protein ExbD